MSLLPSCTQLREHQRRTAGRHQTSDADAEMRSGRITAGRILSLDIQFVWRTNGVASTVALERGRLSGKEGTGRDEQCDFQCGSAPVNVHDIG